MIELHRLDDTKLLINTDLIEMVEETPDTVITLTNGNKYIVKEKISMIVLEIMDFKSNVQFKRFTVMEDVKTTLIKEVKKELCLKAKADTKKSKK